MVTVVGVGRVRKLRHVGLLRVVKLSVRVDDRVLLGQWVQVVLVFGTRGTPQRRHGDRGHTRRRSSGEVGLWEAKPFLAAERVHRAVERTVVGHLSIEPRVPRAAKGWGGVGWGGVGRGGVGRR